MSVRAAHPLFRTAPAIVAGLIVIVIVAHYRVAILAETYVARDAIDLMMPAHTILAMALRSGRLPEWADSIGIGVPFAADPLNGVMYPPYWLVALVPADLGRDVLTLAHLAAGGLGVAAFAHRLGSGALGAWLSGGVFVTCGYVASMPANNNAQLLCWVPWVAWAAERIARPAQVRVARARLINGALFAALFSAQLIVGEPAHIVASAVLAGIVLLARAERPGAAFGDAAAALIAAVPLASASLLPVLAVLGWTTRAGWLVTGQEAVWPMPPLRVLEWIWPGLLGAQIGPGGLTENLARALDPRLVDDVQKATWAFSVYVGVPALALAAWASLAGRSERRLLGGALIFVLLALGPATPFGPAFGWLVPPANLARFPEKYLVGFMVLCSALAGIGLGRLVRGGGDRRLLSVAAGGALLLAVAVGSATLFQSDLATFVADRTAGAVLPFDPAAAVRRSLVSGGWAVAVATAFVILLAIALRRRTPVWALLASVVMMGDLVLNCWSVNPTMPRARLESPPRLLAGLPAALPPALPTRIWIHSRRALGPADFSSGVAFGEYNFQSVGGNIATRYGFAALPGATAVTSTAFRQLMRLEAGATLVGVEYVVLLDGLVGEGEFPIVARDRPVGAVVMRARDPRPRAFVAPRWVQSDDPAEQLPRVAASGDRGLVLLQGPGDRPGPLAAEDPVGACEATSARPERVDLVCSSRRGGYAVLLDAEAPGWSATVDGLEVPIERADMAFRAVRVGPGSHHVVFRYQTPWLRAGGAIALVSWAGWLALVLAALRRPRRDTDPVPAPPPPRTHRSHDRSGRPAP